MTKENINGQAWCFGKNINTDLIYPGRCLSITKPDDMAKCAFAGLEPKFGSQVKTGDIIVADENLGCGSSREQAAICIRYAGVGAVVAVSFARIFYRNLINQGIPALISRDAIDVVNTGDSINIDLAKNIISNTTTGKNCTFEPIPDFLMDIINGGGNIPYLRKKIRLK